jgi:hypothetical protein
MGVSLNLNSTVRRDPDVITATVDDALVMVSIANGFYYGASDVARDIWNSLETPKKISRLIDELTMAYNVDRAMCEKQTLSFLEDLLNEKLMLVSDDAVE